MRNKLNQPLIESTPQINYSLATFSIIIDVIEVASCLNEIPSLLCLVFCLLLVLIVCFSVLLLLLGVSYMSATRSDPPQRAMVSLPPLSGNNNGVGSLERTVSASHAAAAAAAAGIHQRHSSDHHYDPYYHAMPCCSSSLCVCVCYIDMCICPYC